MEVISIDKSFEVVSDSISGAVSRFYKTVYLFTATTEYFSWMEDFIQRLGQTDGLLKLLKILNVPVGDYRSLNIDYKTLIGEITVVEIRKHDRNNYR